MLTFQTLLLREWLQHRTGWLLLGLLPLALAVLAGGFGSVQISADELASSVVLAVAGGYVVGLSALAWAVTSLQAAGLARRDVQDRSIEFWRSLPVSDVQAVAATVCVNALLVPLALTAFALVCSLPVGVLIALRVFGMNTFAALSIDGLLPIVLAAVPRFLVGGVLAALWLAPLTLLGMAASAWLKRWGLPALAAVWLGGGLLLQEAYGLPQPLQALQGLAENFGAALVPLVNGELPMREPALLPALLWQDLLARLQDLASPLSLLALALSATGFALLVLRRQRGG